LPSICVSGIRGKSKPGLVIGTLARAESCLKNGGQWLVAGGQYLVVSEKSR
jgi:hypothetical protein